MRFTASTLIADAWKLWRSDRDVLTRIASVFMLLPVLAVTLLLEPELARTMDALAPDDTTGRLTAFAAWMGQNAPWLLSAQIVAHFGALAILVFYLDRLRPDVGTALRSALGWLTLYLIAMLIVSLLAAIGIFAFVIGYFFVLARLSMVGPVMIAERQSNPILAVARSITLTRGRSFALTGVVMIVLLGGYIAQTPFNIIDTWMTIYAPNPIARAMVDVISSAITALTAIAMVLVQVSAWRRLSSS